MLIMVLRVRDFRMLILVVIRPPVRVSHGLPLPRTEPGKECIKGCLGAWWGYGKPGDGVLGAVVSAAPDMVDETALLDERGDHGVHLALAEPGSPQQPRGFHRVPDLTRGQPGVFGEDDQRLVLAVGEPGWRPVHDLSDELDRHHGSPSPVAATLSQDEELAGESCQRPGRRSGPFRLSGGIASAAAIDIPGKVGL